MKIDTFDKFNEYIQNYIDKKKIPSLAILAVKNTKIVYSKTFGSIDYEKKIKSDNDTLYKTYSITKIFTAIAIMQLYENNKLNLEDPVSKYITFFRPYYKKSKAKPIIKIKHLLQHASGLKNNIPEIIGWMHFENIKPKNQTEFTKKVFNKYQNLLFLPGKKGYYSNVGYMLLGVIIEKVSGQKYEDYIIKNILKPLKMNNSCFHHDDYNKKNIAMASHPMFSIEAMLMSLYYSSLKKICIIKDNKLWIPTFYPNSTPPSGLISSLNDMAKFIIFILNIDNNNKILKKETFLKMLNIELIKAEKIYGTNHKDTKFGYAWKINEKNKYIYHDGTAPGYGSMIRLYLDKKIGIILLSNDTTIKRDYIINLLTPLIY